jgi:hypothetical protein
MSEYAISRWEMEAESIKYLLTNNPNVKILMTCKSDMYKVYFYQTYNTTAGKTCTALSRYRRVVVPSVSMVQYDLYKFITKLCMI